MFWKKRVYLDYASAHPVRKEAVRAYARAATAFGNPSSAHEEGRRAKKILEQARVDIARLTEVKADDIIFTSGATDANNIAIRGLLKPGAHFLYLPSAHASIVETMKAVEKEGVIVEPLIVTDGEIDIEALKKQLRPETVLVSMDAVCGETGVVWNTREVKNALPQKVYLHIDASQAPLTEKITRAHFNADMVTFDSQKVGGMRGIGCLVAHRTIPLAPILFGGGQERGLRPGTESPALAAAFAAALRDAVLEREVFQLQALHSRVRLISAIASIPQLHINEGKRQSPHILNISLPGRDTDYLIALLDDAGVAVSTRSACETDSEEDSRAVFVLTGDQERAKSTVRISWGETTTANDILRFATVLRESIHFIDNTSR